MFQRAPLPHDWARRNRPIFEEVCENHARGLQEELDAYEKRTAELEQERKERGHSETHMRAMTKAYGESRDRQIKYFTWVVQSFSVKDVGHYESPAWHHLPGCRVARSGGSANEYGMFPMTVGETREVWPYPAKKALTSAEARQLRESPGQ